MFAAWLLKIAGLYAIIKHQVQGEVTDMSTLQARIYAEKWFELAINKNKLADFVIGLPPYAEHRSDGGEILMPLLGPNAEVLYDYHAENKDANYDLVQNMLTPFEKSVLLDLRNAKSIGFETENETTKLKTSTTIYSKEEINSVKTLNKIFSLSKVKVDGKEKDLTSIVKDEYKWTIGVH